MANLDKLLKQIEKNQANDQEDITTNITIGGENFELRKLRRNDKREYSYIFSELCMGYARKGEKPNIPMAKLAKISIPYIYKSVVELPQLAVKAKEKGLITAYYDIVEETFDVFQLMEIVTEILTFNNITPEDAASEVEALKKQ